jgi:hypothetical protein
MALQLMDLTATSLSSSSITKMRPLVRPGFTLRKPSVLPSSVRRFATEIDAPANGRERVVILGSGWAGKTLDMILENN